MVLKCLDPNTLLFFFTMTEHILSIVVLKCLLSRSTKFYSIQVVSSLTNMYFEIFSPIYVSCFLLPYSCYRLISTSFIFCLSSLFLGFNPTFLPILVCVSTYFNTLQDLLLLLTRQSLIRSIRNMSERFYLHLFFLAWRNR